VVERLLPKQKIAGSNPVTCSSFRESAEPPIDFALMDPCRSARAKSKKVRQFFCEAGRRFAAAGGGLPKVRNF
tara:strand:- start:6261 stop:6479 length:219 start_codon:yes stop_codon:yes gene_type:complete